MEENYSLQLEELINRLTIIKNFNDKLISESSGQVGGNQKRKIKDFLKKEENSFKKIVTSSNDLRNNFERLLMGINKLETLYNEADTLTQPNSTGFFEITQQSTGTNVVPTAAPEILDIIDGIPTHINFKRNKFAKLVLDHGKYIPIQEVGSGSFGRVFKSYSRDDKNYVAVKLIEKDKTDAKYLTLEHRAHLILNNLEEPVIHFYCDYELNNDFRIIVLELADESLDSFLNRKFPNGMPEKIAFFFFEQIYRGIKYIHSNKIIHRDIKTENVLLKSMEVKLCDFNVCRFLDFADEGKALITIVGSPKYCPPEFIKGNNELSKEDLLKVDVYSLGILLYVLLYGKHPYDVISKYKHGDIMARAIDKIDYKNCDHEVSPEAIDFIKKCIKPEAKDRLSLDEIRKTMWFRKNGREFNEVVNSMNIVEHTELYKELEKRSK